MADLLAAALGGSLVAATTAVGRAAGIPADVRTHDAMIRDRDDQLATWVADRNHELKRECQAIRRPPGNHVIALTRELDQAIADARAAALHQYRDQARLAALDVARVLAGEGWPHRVYRRLYRKAIPELATPARATPVLDSWRRQSSESSDDRPVWPEDATKRTLDDAIASIRALDP